ncbi:MAG: hypothetical protein KGP28_05305 [Bdellovibrionales bacterium]|nr:hypothetical protein [Bdellovibrionales bacterium]
MTHAHKIFIRTKKEDSAFVYHVFEAHEGLVSYSTLPHQAHDPFRDLELLVTEELRSDLEALLEDMREYVTVLPSS